MNKDSKAQHSNVLLKYVMKHLPATQTVAEAWLDKHAPHWRQKAKETLCKPTHSKSKAESA